MAIRRHGIACKAYLCPKFTVMIDPYHGNSRLSHIELAKYTDEVRWLYWEVCKDDQLFSTEFSIYTAGSNCIWPRVFSLANY